MVHPITAGVQNNETFSIQGISLTEAKITQIALGFFAALTATVGMIAFSVGTGVSLFLAIPCFAASGAIVWIISTIHDYKDPASLREMRAKAAQQPLASIIREHGWEKMMKYQILEPKVFEEKYRVAMETKSISEIIPFYEEAIKMKNLYGNKDFVIPPPSEFKIQFKKDIDKMAIGEVVKKYDIPLLEKHGIIGKDFAKICSDFKAAQTSAQTYAANENRAFQGTVKKLLLEFQGTVNLAQPEGMHGIYWIDQLKREVAHLLTFSAGDFYKADLHIFEPISDQTKAWAYANQLGYVLDALETLQNEVTDEKISRDDNINAMFTNLDGRFKNLNLASYL